MTTTDRAFTPSRLTVARKRRGLNKTQLAKRVGLSARSITAYESGATEPTPANVTDISRVLGFPATFFAGSELEEPTVDAVNFRSLTTMTAAQRDKALGAAALALEIASWIEEHFDLPPVAIPRMRGYDAEAAADALRAEWGLGERPLKNVVHLLESKGARVFSLAEGCKQLDAFSFWHGSTPYVFLNAAKSSERSRFDACHELGHLVLHRHGGPRHREFEVEADRFASAFLMPHASVIAHAPRFCTIDALIKLKSIWNVSVAALAHRLHRLEMVSEWHYRTLCIEISERGFRSNEPKSQPRERSQVYEKVFTALRNEGKTRSEVARELNLQPQDLEALVFGLTVVRDTN
jgi:Zn-dependent peptidase ImmA (M78 family)/DNA-binding XRE family transcriptional regulator